jgi:hypothetical protein
MKRSIALSLVVLLVATTGARADVRARITATDPAGDAIELARDEALYVRIEYATDKPVSLWVRPYFGGREVGTRSNAAIGHDGEGEALGWFSFIHPGEVDEIRILAGDGSRAGTHEVASYRIRAVGTDAQATRRARAAWVDELARQEETVRRTEYEKRMSEPVSAGDSLLVSGFMLTILALLVGALAWPAWGVWKWRGAWRAAAAIPTSVIVFVVLRIIVDTQRDPTSHNLWPFEIVIWGGAGVALMLVLGIARRIVRAGE